VDVDVEQHPMRFPERPWPRDRERLAVGLVVAGALLLGASTVFILVADSVMSRSAYTGLTLLALYLVLAYGLLWALHTRNVHVRKERLYSAHLEELSERLRTMAYRDVLTGLYNHRYFHEQLGHEIDRSVRYGQPLTVMLMDMDNFKVINDVYGHLVGDKFLAMVGEIIAKQVRSSDIASRYGGDEFAIILPNTSTEDAMAISVKLEEAVTSAASLHASAAAFRLGISVGCATCPTDARLASDLLEIADRQLYEQKAVHKAHRRASA
jgi:diguanylate cyclase (GGDEF)-like protein